MKNPKTDGKSNPTSKKLSGKEKRFLDDLEESIKWVKLHQQGKVKAKTIEELLEEL